MRVAQVYQKVQAKWRSCSPGVRRKLRSWGLSAANADLRVRCKIVWNLVRGESTSKIASILGCSVSQVYRVAGKFVQEGELALADRREDNGETKVDEAYQAELLRLVAADSPQDHGYRRPTWTQELLALVMEQQTGTRISQSRMSRLLRELGIRLGRPKPIVGCPWEKRRRTRRLRELARLIDNVPNDEVVVYADEVDIDLNPKIGPDYMVRGSQKQVITPGKNHKRYLAGALNAKTGQLTWVEWDKKDSDLFIRQLWQLAERDYADAKCIHVILDNYCIHDSVRTQMALAALANRVRLHFLPPYCPDHNRIERVWKDLHDNVTRNHRCRNLDELMEEVRAYLKIRKNAMRHEYAKKSAA